MMGMTGCLIGFHDHEPVSVQSPASLAVPATFVLYRCRRCGDVHSEELDGTWTLEEIKGGRP